MDVLHKLNTWTDSVVNGPSNAPTGNSYNEVISVLEHVSNTIKGLHHLDKLYDVLSDLTLRQSHFHIKQIPVAFPQGNVTDILLILQLVVSFHIVSFSITFYVAFPLIQFP